MQYLNNNKIQRILSFPDEWYISLNTLYKSELKREFDIDKRIKIILVKENNSKIDHVVYLDVEDKIILDRILKRRICSLDSCREIYNLEFKKPLSEGICDKCGSKLIQRPDDNEDVFRERLEVYRKTSPEIIDYYRSTGVLCTKQITLENHKTSNDVAKEFVEFAKKNK